MQAHGEGLHRDFSSRISSNDGNSDDFEIDGSLISRSLRILQIKKSDFPRFFRELKLDLLWGPASAPINGKEEHVPLHSEKDPSDPPSEQGPRDLRPLSWSVFWLGRRPGGDVCCLVSLKDSSQLRWVRGAQLSLCRPSSFRCELLPTASAASAGGGELLIRFDSANSLYVRPQDAANARPRPVAGGKAGGFPALLPLVQGRGPTAARRVAGDSRGRTSPSRGRGAAAHTGVHFCANCEVISSSSTPGRAERMASDRQGDVGWTPPRAPVMTRQLSGSSPGSSRGKLRSEYQASAVRGVFVQKKTACVSSRRSCLLSITRTAGVCVVVRRQTDGKRCDPLSSVQKRSCCTCPFTARARERERERD